MVQAVRPAATASLASDLLALRFTKSAMTALPARRAFLRRIGLASAGLLASRASAAAQPEPQVFRSNVEIVTRSDCTEERQQRTVVRPIARSTRLRHPYTLTRAGGRCESLRRNQR